MSGSITDVLALAEAINARSSSDARFTELLGEISTALAEILAAMESKGAAPAPKPLDAEAMSKALAAALVVAIKNMPVPTIKLPAMEQTSWQALDVDFKRGENGLSGMRITRAN